MPRKKGSGNKSKISKKSGKKVIKERKKREIKKTAKREPAKPEKRQRKKAGKKAEKKVEKKLLKKQAKREKKNKSEGSKITKDVVYAYLDIPEKDFRDMPPVEVKPMMNAFAMYIQKYGEDDVIFNRILAYMHKFVFATAYRKFIIPGMEGKDVYQEACIALCRRAINKFNPDKNMSFVNFSKMCMKRYIITLLNTAKNRRRDQPLNRSIPLEQAFPSEDESEDNGCLMNVLGDEFDFLKDMCCNEDVRMTKELLGKTLSPLEYDVFIMHLEKRSYRDIAKEVSRKYQRRYNEKSVDNALIRVRAKATSLRTQCDVKIPLFDED
jgi:RNA polymerase sigma-H factor